jgi:hypothetical protein
MHNENSFKNLLWHISSFILSFPFSILIWLPEEGNERKYVRMSLHLELNIKSHMERKVNITLSMNQNGIWRYRNDILDLLTREKNSSNWDSEKLLRLWRQLRKETNSKLAFWQQFISLEIAMVLTLHSDYEDGLDTCVILISIYIRHMYSNFWN